jgi:hypothetical protein
MTETIDLTELRRVPLGGKRGAGQFALVDLAKVEEVVRFSWYLHHGYVEAAVWHSAGARKTSTGMHRVVMPGYGRLDHVNGVRLDNRVANLRPATAKQNMANSGPRGASGYRNVTLAEPTKHKKWRAYIYTDYHQTFRSLGYFATPEEAARAYDAVALKIYGEFARLNFPTSLPSALTPDQWNAVEVVS